MKKIDCVVKKYKNDVDWMVDSLVENIHREDLNSKAKATYIKKIWIAMGKPIQQKGNYKGNPDYKILAKQLSQDEATIRNGFNLLELPKIVQKAVEKGKLGGWDALA